ncbi:MAG: phosphohydrolase [Lachnospiraceae bacterium]|nr:phosphohydrolase [Lachnospiraceae bacterium]
MSTYMKTYSGLRIDPFDPRPEEIHIEDIAHALSLICRGNGQVTHFYSVAQHCLNCEREAEARGHGRRLRLACLLHDASEAYLNDIIRPVKQYLTKYIETEDHFLDVIYQSFGLGDLTREEWDVVREIDDALLDYDLVELLREPMPEGGYQFTTKPDIEQRPFEEVEAAYIRKAKELMDA